MVDSYVQLGLYKRSKSFVNLKANFSSYKSPKKSVFAKYGLDNNPFGAFRIGLSSVGKSYERKVYGWNDMLGNVGGIFGILQTITSLLVYVLCSNSIDLQYISILNSPQYKTSSASKE